MKTRITKCLNFENHMIPTRNEDILRDLSVESVCSEIAKRSKSYLNKLYTHQNEETRTK